MSWIDDEVEFWMEQRRALNLDKTDEHVDMIDKRYELRKITIREGAITYAIRDTETNKDIFLCRDGQQDAMIEFFKEQNK